MTKPLSLILATIDRPEQLTCALTAYTHWNRELFDIWIMDDSGADRIVSACKPFRDKLDMHLVKFTGKAPNYWRGPEMAYAKGLSMATGDAACITQEGALVPADMLEPLLNHLKQHEIVNIFTIREHPSDDEDSFPQSKKWDPLDPRGMCAQTYGVDKLDLCNVPDQDSVVKMFMGRAVCTDELFQWHSIPHMEYDWCTFYVATRQAWQKLNYFAIDEDFGYGATDLMLMRRRKKENLERFVPPDLMIFDLEAYDRDDMAAVKVNRSKSSPASEMLY